MVNVFDDFKGFPNSVRNAVLFLVAGWIWHFFSLYRYFLNGEVPTNQIVIALVSCYFVFRVKNWARVLCIAGNILIVVTYLFLAVVFFSAGESHKGVAASLSIVLFSLASYYLFVGESSRFFKEKSPGPANEGISNIKPD